MKNKRSPAFQPLELEPVEEVADRMFRNGIQNMGLEQKPQIVNLWKGLLSNRALGWSCMLWGTHELQPRQIKATVRLDT